MLCWNAHDSRIIRCGAVSSDGRLSLSIHTYACVRDGLCVNLIQDNTNHAQQRNLKSIVDHYVFDFDVGRDDSRKTFPRPFRHFVIYSIVVQRSFFSDSSDTACSRILLFCLLIYNIMFLNSALLRASCKMHLCVWILLQRKHIYLPYHHHCIVYAYTSRYISRDFANACKNVRINIGMSYIFSHALLYCRCLYT